MNPVLSDLSIRVALVEAETRVAAAQRRQLARGATPAPITLAGRVGAVVEAIREFVDPRGYAMRRLPANEVAPAVPVVIEAVAPSGLPSEAAPSGTPTMIRCPAATDQAAKSAA